MAFNARLLSAHAAFISLARIEGQFVQRFFEENDPTNPPPPILYGKALGEAVEADCIQYDYSKHYYPIVYALARGVLDAFYTTPLTAEQIVQDIVETREGIVKQRMSQRQIEFINEARGFVRFCTDHPRLDIKPNTFSDTQERITIAARIFSEKAAPLTNEEKHELHYVSRNADFIKKPPPRIPFIIPPFGDA